MNKTFIKENEVFQKKQRKILELDSMQYREYLARQRAWTKWLTWKILKITQREEETEKKREKIKESLHGLQIFNHVFWKIFQDKQDFRHREERQGQS